MREKSEATLQQAQHCFLKYLTQPATQFRLVQPHNMGGLLAAKLSV